MTDFCYPFSHNFKLPTKDDIFPNNEIKIQSKLDKELLDPEFYKILTEVDIDVRWIEVHYKIPLPAVIKQSIYGSIHADGDKIDNKSKINFILGGTDSSMIWWKLKNEETFEAQTTIDTTCIRPKSIKDVEEVHRESFRAAIVNVGQIHSIENTIDERIAIECILQDAKTKDRLDFCESVRRVKIIEHILHPQL